MSAKRPTDAEQWLANYVLAYVTEFNILRGELAKAGSPASLYSKEIVAACIVAVSDGYAIVYVDEETRASENQPKGVGLYYETETTLTHYMQSISANLIKVYQRSTGASMFNAHLPPDIPIQKWRGGISSRVLKPYLETGQAGPQLTGMAVGQIWSVEQGICVRPLPTRWRIFTPYIPLIPDNRPALQFIYPFYDLIWDQEQLKLTSNAGRLFARTDIEVLLQGIRAGIPPHQLAEDPFNAVASHCERACDQLLLLVDNPSTDEKQVQLFLEQPGNRFLISAHSTNIIPQKSLAGLRYRIDFAVQRPDSDYHLVEIESPNTLIYQSKGEEPSAPFTHAIQQVEDWLRYVEDNRATVRAEDGLPTIHKPSGEVVIGRDKHIGEVARKRFDFKRAECGIILKTYDMMIAEGRAYGAALRGMQKGESPNYR